jgi:predicted  nucleic acid-binding Zn-ribbon protein
VAPSDHDGQGAQGEKRKMLTDDELMGIKKRDMAQLKEIKVKLPVRYLINLHYVKLTSNQNISDVVNSALTRYFETHPPGRRQTANDE